MEDHNEPPIPPMLDHDDEDAQSEVGDGSSSLSDIEQDAEQDDQHDIEDLDSDEPSDEDDEEENDSEAETERLHLSPMKDRAHKDVVMTDTHTFERQPSNLHNEYGADEDEEDDEDEDEEEIDEGENTMHNDDVSDDELSLPDSPKSGAGNAVAEDVDDDTESPLKPTTTAPSAPKDIMHAFDLTNKKRKRSQAVVDRGSLGQNDEEEPSMKRTGSVLATGDDYVVDDDDASEHDGMDTPNPISGDLSDLESIDGQEDEDEAETIGKPQALAATGENMDTLEDITLDRHARKSVSKVRPVLLDEVEAAAKEELEEAEQLDDTAEVEADDDAEAALKDEAERK